MTVRKLSPFQMKAARKRNDKIRSDAKTSLERRAWMAEWAATKAMGQRRGEWILFEGKSWQAMMTRYLKKNPPNFRSETYDHP